QHYSVGGLAQRLVESYFDFLLAVDQDDHEVEIYDRLFRGGRVDAVIVPNTRVKDNRIAFLQAKGYPFVAYGRTADSRLYSWFDFDNAQCSHLAVEHLLSLGHTQIAYLHSPLELNFAAGRHQGFLHALQVAGLQCSPDRVISGVNDRRSGVKAVQTLLQHS
ncbi:MAG: LacI family transcriptional regulator, partial [Rhodoferax sp.]